MNNLIIGETAQLAFYFPENFQKISSRNINFDFFKNKNFDSVYILFAEQRTFLKESESFFVETNVNYTLKVINFFKNIAKKIIIYSTSELWNNCDGAVSINTNYNYNYTPYIKSKEILCNFINEHKSSYSNVHIVYPFNFNSPYRKEGFLFSKIFLSLLKKEKITIGNIDFFRDIIHPSVIINNSLNLSKDILIGSGELINIKNFVKDLYTNLNLNYLEYININDANNLSNERKNYFSLDKYSNYKELLELTHNDIKKYNISKRHN